MSESGSFQDAFAFAVCETLDILANLMIVSVNHIFVQSFNLRNWYIALLQAAYDY